MSALSSGPILLRPDRFDRLDDDQAVTPFREPATSQDPKSAICVAEPRSGLTALENDELLLKAEILGNQSRFGFKDGADCIGKVPNHRQGP